MYAVIQTGGKQYKIKEGDVIVVEKLAGQKGDKVEFPMVILAASEEKIITETAELKKLHIEGTIIDHFLGDKVIAFKYKPRKRYRRKKGHRQQLTKIKVESVGAKGKEEKAEKKQAKAVKPEAAKVPTKKAAPAKKTATAVKPEPKKAAPKKAPAKKAAPAKKTAPKKPAAPKTDTKKAVAKKAPAKKVNS